MMHVRQTRIWHTLISEPWVWFSHSFFQPVDFSRRAETMPFKQRMLTIVRMYPVILLLSYPLAMIVRTLLCLMNSSLYSTYFPQHFSLFAPGTPAFYFDGTWAAILGCILAGLFG